MFSVKFLARVGEEYISVEITQPNGSGSYCYYIMENGAFCGSMVKRNNEWVQLNINRHEFTLDDIQAMGEIVDFLRGGVKM